MKLTTIFICLTALLLLASAVPLQNEYDLSWWKISSGAYTLEHDEGYSLRGTIGQAEASGLHGGSYTLIGGFWGSEIPPIIVDSYATYLPLIAKN